MTKSTKKLLIILGIVLAIFAVQLITSSTGEDTGFEDLAAPSEASIEMAKVLSGAQRITAIKLDTTLLEEKRYQTLTDFGVTIKDVKTGRTNPFAPLQD